MKNFKAIQAFYKFKGLLLPAFLERNKRSLNSVEAELIKEFEKQQKDNIPFPGAY